MISAMFLLLAIWSTMAKALSSFSVSYLLRFVTSMIILFISLLVILVAMDSSKVYGRLMVLKISTILPGLVRPLVNLLLTLATLILILALSNLLFIVIVFSMFLCFG